MSPSGVRELKALPKLRHFAIDVREWNEDWLNSFAQLTWLDTLDFDSTEEGSSSETSRWIERLAAALPNASLFW